MSRAISVYLPRLGLFAMIGGAMAVGGIPGIIIGGLVSAFIIYDRWFA